MGKLFARAALYSVLGVAVIIFVIIMSIEPYKAWRKAILEHEMRIADTMNDSRLFEPSQPSASSPKEFQEKIQENEDSIKVFIDDRELDLGTEPEFADGVLMIPITRVAWELGAVCEQPSKLKVNISRALVTAELTLYQSFAIVNGESVKLLKATYIKDSELFGPPNFLAEIFHQIMRIDDNGNVYFYEDDSFAKDSNLKQWIIGASVIICVNNNGDPYKIGMKERSEESAWSECELLKRDWSIYNREDLLDTVARMTNNGHNTEFKTGERYAMNGGSSLLALQTAADKLKWGDRGIAAWDWFRMLHLLSWGYRAGYLDLTEVYVLAEPLAQKLRTTFSSWDEAVENYMDGYAYWSGTDKSLPGTRYKDRLKIYERMKNAEQDGFRLFDPAVWDEPVIGIGQTIKEI